MEELWRSFGADQLSTREKRSGANVRAQIGETPDQQFPKQRIHMITLTSGTLKVTRRTKSNVQEHPITSPAAVKLSNHRKGGVETRSKSRKPKD